MIIVVWPTQLRMDQRWLAGSEFRQLAALQVLAISRDHAEVAMTLLVSVYGSAT